MQLEAEKRTLYLSEEIYVDFLKVQENNQIKTCIHRLYWASGTQNYTLASGIEIYNFHQILNEFLMNKLEYNVSYSYKSVNENYTFHAYNSKSFNIIFQDDCNTCNISIDEIYVQMIYNNLDRLLNQCDITLNSVSSTSLKFVDNGMFTEASSIGFKKEPMVENNIDFKKDDRFNIKSMLKIK